MRDATSVSMSHSRIFSFGREQGKRARTAQAAPTNQTADSTPDLLVISCAFSYS
jgi:hypothetical protein